MNQGMETLAAAAHRLGTRLVGPDTRFERVVTDTRSLRAGDLFVALKGEHFDGHHFLAQAAEAGACGAIVSGEFLQQRKPDAHPRLGLIPVGDTLGALQAYGASWRRDFSMPLVGVTGSNGKTTTKQLLASVLAARGAVLATEGNLNNHIGVPLMLARIRAEHRSAVIEMGASAAGEIALLAKLAAPGIGIVTQAGDAHLEGFGTREGVAKAKGELFAALQGGTAIINADDAYCGLWLRMAEGNQILRFGLGREADVSAEQIAVTPEGSAFMLLTPAGRVGVNLPLAGRHNIANALAAAAAGHALGLAPDVIAQGLAAVLAPKGRVARHTTSEGVRIVDDSYNANPTSLNAAMELLAQEHGTRVLVLGDMAELGANAAALHAQAGERARKLGLEALFTVGPLAAHAAQAFGAGGQAFSSHEALVAKLKPHLAIGMTVLVKGSRSARMEQVVNALLGSAQSPQAAAGAGHHTNSRH